MSAQLKTQINTSYEGHEFACPVVSLDEAKMQVEAWRTQGHKIGFTNGCFDIVHAGHVEYLNHTRSKCDKLILGLNSDASLQRLKGPERPINDQIARATVLASLRAIDLIVFFGDDPADEDTPFNLISALLPDILVKGGDYTIESVVGHDVVQANGGEVYIAFTKEGFSTTNTIQKIRAAEEAEKA